MNGRAIPREKFIQLWTDIFTSPLAKRQRPATEEQETSLEYTLQIWKKENSKNFVYIFSV